MNHDRKTVLVVDDDIDLLKILDRRLSLAGFHVLLASTGEDGLKQAMACTPHAALLDVKLAGSFGGLEVAAALRDHAEMREIPIIFLSGAIDEEFTTSYRDVGGDFYASKPYDPTMVVRMLDSVLARDELAEVERVSHAKRRQPMLD